MATVTTAPTRSTAPSTTPRSLLEIQPLEFESHFTREPFLIRHHLSDHPLFQIERLLELAKALPPENIEYNAGQLPLSVDPNMTPMNGLSVAETIERIQTCKSWMAIKYVENDPKYRDLLHACLDEVRPHSEPIAPGMQKAHGFIFLSSPNSVTPYHIDPEHNFLLQIRGGKTIGMYDGRDKTLLTEQNLEGFYSDKHRNLKLDEARKDDDLPALGEESERCFRLVQHHVPHARSRQASSAVLDQSRSPGARLFSDSGWQEQAA